MPDIKVGKQPDHLTGNVFLAVVGRRHFRHASGRHFHPAPPALLGEGGELGFREVDSSTLCDVDGYAREAATPARRALVNALSVLCDLALIALAALSVAALASGSFSSFVYAAF